MRLEPGHERFIIDEEEDEEDVDGQADEDEGHFLPQRERVPYCACFGQEDDGFCDGFGLELVRALGGGGTSARPGGPGVVGVARFEGRGRGRGRR